MNIRNLFWRIEKRFLSHGNQINNKVKLPEPELDVDFICNPKNRDLISENINRRKGIGSIDKVLALSKDGQFGKNFLEALEKIPNLTHPDVFKYKNDAKILKEYLKKDSFNFKPKEFMDLVKNLKLLRNENLGPVAGHKSYIFLGDLARMEDALVQYSIRKLINNGFELISVPDILPCKVIEKCGMINDERSLIYNLDQRYQNNSSLSGTAEMSLAMKLINHQFTCQDLPAKFAAVSRCFRAEVSNSADEQGIYRVHHFTKVEMFIVTKPQDSSNFLQEIVNIQEEFFKDLGLAFKIIDMPPHELGASAFRKIDIEGWLPGKKAFGELSSCSNCTDYQSRRLNIKFKDVNTLKHVHTLNGTACAIPRMLIALCETYQTENGDIQIPNPLQPFLNGKNIIKKQNIANMRDFKYKPTILN